jgi:hypothetical protein
VAVKTAYPLSKAAKMTQGRFLTILR